MTKPTDGVIRVLILDADETTSEQLVWMLETSVRTRFAVTNATEVDRAVEEGRERRTDAIIVNLGTDDEAGMDRFIELSTQVPEVPVVVVTTAAHSQQAELAVQLGAQDHLVFGQAGADEVRRCIRYAIDRHRMLTSRQEMFAHISHELRTPLFAILGHAELMLEPEFPLDDPDEIRDFASTIKETSQQLLAQVNEILDLSKVIAGGMELFLEDVDAHTVLTDIAHAVRPLARDKRQTLAVAPAGDDVQLARADRNRLRQIVLNLVSNAIKYTPPDGRIELGARTIDGEVQVYVSDTGIGIRAEAQRHVFDPYYQVKGIASAGVQASTGLGLALTKRLVELQRGRIWLTSTPGEGSVFTFALPAALASATES